MNARIVSQVASRYLPDNETCWNSLSGSFAICRVAVSGVAPKDGHRWPLIISAAFSQTLSDETKDHLRWRFFRLHFQYLCAFDKPGLYDYFKITAGPLTLAQRFRGRRPSAQRIDVPASRFTSMVR